MKKKSNIIIASIMLGACSTNPYLVQLDERSEAVNVEKYGKGKYFFHYSKYRFNSKNDADGLISYFQFVSEDIKNSLKSESECEIIEESLSYYSEGGYVSVLVKCNAT